MMKGLGSRVIVLKSIPSVHWAAGQHEGYQIPDAEAVPLAQPFVTTTGCCDVIRFGTHGRQKDEAIVCTSAIS
jgi:adenosylhomocysteinase